MARERHTCHAVGCDTRTAPKLFMCPMHWRMIPRAMQDRLWAVYVPGQEERKDPTAEYLDVARELIDYVARECGYVCPGCNEPLRMVSMRPITHICGTSFALVTGRIERVGA